MKEENDLIGTTEILFFIAGEGNEHLRMQAVFPHEVDGGSIGNRVIEGSEVDAILKAGVVAVIERVDVGGNQHEGQGGVKMAMRIEERERKLRHDLIGSGVEQFVNAGDAVCASEDSAVIRAGKCELAGEIQEAEGPFIRRIDRPDTQPASQAVGGASPAIVVRRRHVEHARIINFVGYAACFADGGFIHGWGF